MDDSSASAKEMSLAIRGYGLLAAVSAHFLFLHCTYSIVLNGVGSDGQFLKIKLSPYKLLQHPWHNIHTDDFLSIVLH